MPHDGFGDSGSGQAFGQAPLGYTPRWRHPMPSSPLLFSFRFYVFGLALRWQVASSSLRRRVCSG